MTGSAATAARKTLHDAQDVACATIRTWATDAEVIAAVQIDCHERGTRFRRDLAENVQATYHAVRKRAAIGGDGTTSTRQLARDLYADVGDDLEKWRDRRESVSRWLKLLERQGLIERSELRSRNGAGKALGLRISLLPVPTAVVKAAEMTLQPTELQPREDAIISPLARRRGAHEARVRPWCPRAGRGAPRRLSKPRPLSFSPRKLGHLEDRGSRPPIGGLPPVHLRSTQAARARGSNFTEGIAACQPHGSAHQSAALGERVAKALGEGALRTLLAAENAFEAHFGWDARLARLAWRREHDKPVGDLPRGSGLGDLPTVRRLWWVLQRLDRYANFGAGSPGAGLQLLEDLIAGHAAEVAEGYGRVPRSLAYFLPELEDEARHQKHTWAPRIKDQRIAEGRRPARRGTPNPGTGGPALGRDPRQPLKPFRGRRRYRKGRGQ